MLKNQTVDMNNSVPEVDSMIKFNVIGVMCLKKKKKKKKNIRSTSEKIISYQLI